LWFKYTKFNFFTDKHLTVYKKTDYGNKKFYERKKAMNKIPVEIGIIHFIGIGGIGMSGIAELLHSYGYTVTGSDASENLNVARLRKLGIHVTIGQSADNIKDVAVVVYSTAIKLDNPELKEARTRRIPTVRRAEMLAELMRLKSCIAIGGTHGKTTTTTMVATLLDKAGLDPTVVNGGIINAYGTNTRRGEGEWMVVEADESDGSFLKLPATFAVITNADAEHLDYYGTAENMVDAFVKFASNVPFYGAAILCTDHPVVRQIAGKIPERRVVTYGFNVQADIRAVNMRFDVTGSCFDIEIQMPNSTDKVIISDLVIPMPGEHNILNSLAAIAVALELKIDISKIIKALSEFEGVKRRFTLVGTYNDIRIIDDYAHHPIEIMATLKAARQSVGTGKVIAVLQPHRYTRLKELFDDFAGSLHNADSVYITDVYSAGEQPIDDYNAEKLVSAVIANGHKDVHYLPSLNDLTHIIPDKCTTGDLVLMMGAGSITYDANSLCERLQAQKAA
jgi:UDP-N-acetylmuramate--alanine ligase